MYISYKSRKIYFKYLAEKPQGLIMAIASLLGSSQMDQLKYSITSPTLLISTSASISASARDSIERWAILPFPELGGGTITYLNEWLVASEL